MDPFPVTFEEDLQGRSCTAAQLDWVVFDYVSILRFLQEVW